MSIGYTELDFINGNAPALNAANMNHIDEGVKACADQLDALGNSATLNVGTGAGDVAAGNAPAGAVTTHESTYAHANLPTAAGKTAADAIGAATGATTALKLANLASPASTTQRGVSLLGASGGAPKLTKMPDGAAAVWSDDAFEATTGWVGTNATLSVSGGALVATAVASAYAANRDNIGAIGGKFIFLRVKKSTNATGTYRIYGRIGSSYATGFRSVTISTEYSIIPVLADIGWTGLSLYCLSGGTIGESLSLDAIWIGDYSYLTGSLSEEAARIANLRGDMPGVGAYASQTITASTTTLPTAAKGDTIGGKKYTFVDALTASPGVEGEVLKDAAGATDADKCKNTLENLNLALSEAARTNNGTLYWAAAVHPFVSSARVNEVLTLTAKTKNGPENAITVVCESGTNHTAGAATLLGGYTDSAAKTIAEVQNNIAGSGTRPAAAKIELTNTALIGYETTVDVASGATLTLPAGGTWFWNVYGYGATISSAKRGSSAGGTTLTVAGANATVWYRRYA